jgi:2-desacetyl-2-hydroxyethyl bacteriochlorophyllide A dehydrogenase
VPEISIVIRAYNEERRLPALFVGLDRQRYRDFETVVVDSGSFDRTRVIAEQRADRLVRIQSDDFTFGHSLNVGIRHGRGRVVVVVSAHTEPTTDDWLERLVAPLRDGTTALVYGRQVGGADSKFSECRDFERTFGPGPKVLRLPHFFANNANSAIRRDLWEAHAFDETLPGLEDIEWAKHWMERGYRVVYAPDACVYHIHTETWPQVHRRYYREGQAAKWIGIRGRRDIPGEIWRESAHALGDFAAAMRDGRLRATAREILRFRCEKVQGSVAGIWSGAMMANPLRRERLFFNRSYTAVVVRGPQRASLEARELAPLRPGEVLVRVAYAAVSTGDLDVVRGDAGAPSAHPTYPIVPGRDFSGTVAAVGARVTDVTEGDHVVVDTVQGCGLCPTCHGGPGGCSDRHELGVRGRDGGYAEYVATPGRFLHRVPAATTLKEAVLGQQLAAVLKGLERLERCWSVSGEVSCAVVGAGVVGHLAARLLALRGQQVTIYDRDPARLACFDGSDVRAEPAITDFSGAGAIVETTGDPELLVTALTSAPAGAAVLLLGRRYGQLGREVEALTGSDLTLIGSVGGAPEHLGAALATLPKLDLKALTEHVMPLAEFRQAWSIVGAGRHPMVLLAVEESRG